MIVECKFCNGSGSVYSGGLLLGTRQVCPACKGIGIIKRPQIGKEQTIKKNRILSESPRLSHYEYDVTVSFAGEDRGIVKEYCDILTSNGLNVFYDEYKQVDLWGANLYDKLDDIYRLKALCCVIFISKNYAAKVWTNHERKSAQARALEENREYILPVKIDDTDIPGVPPTIGYIDLRKTTIKKLAEMTIQKVRQLRKRNIACS